METISGRVLGVFNTKSNKSKLYIGSSKYGKVIVQAYLNSKDAVQIKMNDYIQLEGNPQNMKGSKSVSPYILLKNAVLVSRKRLHPYKFLRMI